MIRKSAFAVSILILFLAACGGEEEEAEMETLEPSPLPVMAAVSAVDTLFEVVGSTGRIASARTQRLTAQIQGEIVQAPEYVGMEVSDGESYSGSPPAKVLRGYQAPAAHTGTHRPCTNSNARITGASLHLKLKVCSARPQDWPTRRPACLQPRLSTATPPSERVLTDWCPMYLQGRE